MRGWPATVAVALMLGVLGCSGIIEVPGEVRLRLENASERRFDRLTIYTADGPKVFANLSAGAHTAYFTVSTLYRYATTQIVIGRDTFRLQVIDFVGERPLPPGNYTFAYEVTGSPPWGLSQELERD